MDEDQEYLFSFGKELWHEDGRDSEGYWRENKNNYNTKVTFPYPGIYYLNFKTESNRLPAHVTVMAMKKRGSALPHFWFGVLAILTGVVLNEMKNSTIGKLYYELGDSDDEFKKGSVGSYLGLLFVVLIIVFIIWAEK